MPEKIDLTTLRNEFENFKAETPFGIASRALGDFGKKFDTSDHLGFSLELFPYDLTYDIIAAETPESVVQKINDRLHLTLARQIEDVFANTIMVYCTILDTLKTLEFLSQNCPESRREINLVFSALSKLLAVSSKTTDEHFSFLCNFHGDESIYRDRFAAYQTYTPKDFNTDNFQQMRHLASQHLEKQTSHLTENVDVWLANMSYIVLNQIAFNQTALKEGFYNEIPYGVINGNETPEQAHEKLHNGLSFYAGEAGKISDLACEIVEKTIIVSERICPRNVEGKPQLKP